MIKKCFNFIIFFCVVFGFGCASRKNIKPVEHRLEKSNYIVVRPILEERDTSIGEDVKGPDGKTVRAAKDILLNMDHFDTEGVYIQPAYSRIDRCTIIIPLTKEGAEILEDWTSENISKKIGIFIDGKLAVTPEIKEVYSGPLVIENEFLKSVAEKIRETIIAGGK